MTKLKALILIALMGLSFTQQAFPAITAATHWNIRTDGLDTNGSCFDSTIAGAGTNRSLQAAAQVNVENSAITAITAGINSNVITFTLGYTPSTSDIGNCINVASGTNINAGAYQITAETHTSCPTADCTWTVSGPTNLTTAGGAGAAIVGKMGGAFLTIGNVIGKYVAGNTTDIKAGTYTLTAVVALATAGTQAAPITIRGYNSTPGDAGTKPLITTATNSINLFSMNALGVVRFQNLSFSNTAATRASCVAGVTGATGTAYFLDSVFDGCTSGINDAALVTNIMVRNTWFKNLTSVTGAGILCTGCTTLYSLNNLFKSGAAAGIDYTSSPASPNITSINDIFAGNVNGIKDGSTTSTTALTVIGGSFDSNTANGILSSETTTSVRLLLQNNIFWNNTTAGVSFAFTSPQTDNRAINYYNAYGSNGTARTGLSAGTGDITLTASPFTSSTNWALNNTAGGGAAIRGLCFPGTMQDGVTIGYQDCGAVQVQSTSGSVGGSGFIF